MQISVLELDTSFNLRSNSKDAKAKHRCMPVATDDTTGNFVVLN